MLPQGHQEPCKIVVQDFKPLEIYKYYEIALKTLCNEIRYLDTRLQNYWSDYFVSFFFFSYRAQKALLVSPSELKLEGMK